MRRVALIFLYVGWILSACQPAAPQSPPSQAVRPEISAQNFPALDSSTSAEPILAGIVCEFLNVPCAWVEWPLSGGRRWMPKMSAEVGEFDGYKVSGTHEAYLNLIRGEADLIIAARKPSADEWVEAAVYDVNLEIQPVALDAFIFIVNEENPAAYLTTEQIRAIYTGKLKDWKDAGGPAGEIHPYQRDRNSGSQELMISLVMRSTPMIDAPDMILPTMFAPFYAVSEDLLGIGYSIFFYEQNLAPVEEKVKPIGVDGVYPDPKTIARQEYPYTTEVYAVIRKGETGLNRRLMDWLRSPDGQALVAQTGYVPRYPSE